MNITIRKSVFAVLALFSGSCYAFASGNISNSSFISDDSLGMVITQNSTYLTPGQEFEINVFATCKSKNEISYVTIGGATVPLDKNGVASFKTMGGSIGLHEIPVEVSFKGLVPNKTSIVRYEVGQSNANISLDKMNVLYIGVDNPTWISASGGGDDKIKASIEGGGGQIQKVGAGKYNIRVFTVTDECIVYVYVDEKIAGASRFRVRNIPVPIGTVGGYISGDTVIAKAFMAQEGVGAYLKDFPFEIRYEISGFNLSIQDEKGQIKSVTCTSAYFSTEAKSLMKDHLKPGSIVTIGNLFAKASDGRLIKLLPLLYFIK